MQCDGSEAVSQQRFVQQRDFALAVAEDDRVLQVCHGADQLAQDVALFVRLATDGNERLRQGNVCGRGF